MSTEIVVVPHTHWDREWYEPHDVFRLRLVHMLDRLIQTLEREPKYCFTLDGQAAAIDDYLQMRPEMRDRVIALVTGGQLSIGPFLILLDEFGCDGETIVRNVELGRASSERLGGAMPVGYLPDMFGHAAQMPQILRGFGIGHSALWRGVPGRIQEHAFSWTAPNGDSVRCEYLFDGYGNGLDMFAVKGQLDDLAPDYAARTESWYGADPVLAMLGTDHSAPPEDLIDTIADYDSRGNEPSLRVATLDTYLTEYPTDAEALAALPNAFGELRSHARGNLLPGVFSIRTNLKAEMGRSERALAAAERLDLMYGSGSHRSFFDTAWYRLVESTAHDSVTGCGVDATAEQVGTRIHTAGHIARGVIGSVMGDLAAYRTPEHHIVFNPAGRARRTQVEVTVHNVDAARLAPGAQLLDPLRTVLGDEQLKTADLPKILRRIHGRELFGQQINGYTWGEQSLRFSVAESPVGVWDLAAFTIELEARVAAEPTGELLWHVETIADPRHRALLAVDVDALGIATVNEIDAVAPVDAVVAEGRTLRNAALAATVTDAGLVDIVTASGKTITGALAVSSEGDCGDSYNYGPVDPASAVSSPSAVEITVVEAGPLRGRIKIVRTYDVPGALGADRQRSATTVPLRATTIIELREGEDFLRVSVEHVNTAADHRLRITVPVDGANLTESRSAGQYGVTVRGREGEGGWGEFPLPTYPAYRFAAAGRTALLVNKLSEYELVSEAGESDKLALTLSRSVGMMSVNLHPLRDEPAGSEIAVPGAQYIGVSVTTEFAILVDADDAVIVQASDLYRHEPLTTRGTAEADSAFPSPAISTEFPAELVLESGREVDGEAELRFVNYLDEGVAFAPAAEWTLTDLSGAELDAGAFAAGLPAGQIVTLRTTLTT